MVSLTPQCRANVVRLVAGVVLLTLLLLAYRVAKYAYGETVENWSGGAYWQLVDNVESPVTGRQFAQVAYCNSLGLEGLVVVGGALYGQQKYGRVVYEMVEDNWFYSFQHDTWTPLDISLPNRAGGSLTTIKQNGNRCLMLLQGGTSGYIAEKGDIKPQDTRTDAYLIEVTPVESSNPDSVMNIEVSKTLVEDQYTPTRSYGHSAVLYNNSVYFFGGLYQRSVESTMLVTVDGIHRYSIDDGKYYAVTAKGEQKPLPRSRHLSAMAYNGDNTKWLIYGGCEHSERHDLLGCFQSRLFKGIWSFSFKNSQWEKISGVDQSYNLDQDFRRDASMAFYKDHVFIYGGLYGRTENVRPSMIAAKIDFKENLLNCPRAESPDNFCIVKFRECETDSESRGDCITSPLFGHIRYSSFLRSSDEYSIFGGLGVYPPEKGSNSLKVVERSEIRSLNLEVALNYLESDVVENNIMIFQLVLIVSVITFLIATILLMVQRPRLPPPAEAEAGSARRGGATETAIKSLPLMPYSKDMKAREYVNQHKQNNQQQVQLQVNAAVDGDRDNTCAVQSATELALQDSSSDAKDDSQYKYFDIERGKDASSENVGEGSDMAKDANADGEIQDTSDVRGRDDIDNYSDNESDTCAICICDYEEGDQVRLLPCQHYFHAECIDVWLRKNKACPMCKRDIVEGLEQGKEVVQSGVIVPVADMAPYNRRRRRRPNLRFSVQMISRRFRRNNHVEYSPNNANADADADETTTTSEEIQTNNGVETSVVDETQSDPPTDIEVPGSLRTS